MCLCFCLQAYTKVWVILIYHWSFSAVIIGKGPGRKSSNLSISLTQCTEMFVILIIIILLTNICILCFKWCNFSVHFTSNFYKCYFTNFCVLIFTVRNGEGFELKSNKLAHWTVQYTENGYWPKKWIRLSAKVNAEWAFKVGQQLLARWGYF